VLMTKKDRQLALSQKQSKKVPNTLFFKNLTTDKCGRLE